MGVWEFMKIFIYSLIILLGILAALVIFLFSWQAAPLMEFFSNGAENGPAWAQAYIAKPALTNPKIPVDGAPGSVTGNATSLPIITPVVMATPVFIPTSPDSAPESSPTPNHPTIELTVDVSPTPLPTDTDVPIEKPDLPTNTSGTRRWIDVDLSRQMVYAYEGDTLVNSFLVSTGVAQTPTITGQYRIYVKYHHKDMSGPGYYLPDMPFIMYFFEGYGFHGTYWHNNFGTPMSCGCVNLSIPDSEWLYNFASVGTLINIHY